MILEFPAGPRCKPAIHALSESSLTPTRPFSSFAFKHEFNHRWGSLLYVLLPIGLTVLISGAIVLQTIIKIRGLKFMRSKWDKAK